MSQLTHHPERRVAVRWNSTQQTSCHFATLDKITSRWAAVLNVSVRGIGLTVPCPLEMGQELFVELPSREALPARAIAAQVVHVQRKTEITWALGCVFSRPLSKEELETLV